MPKPKPLTSEELAAVLDGEINDAQSYIGSELARDRAKALDYYYGRPFGDEVEGRSQVVSRDVQETIEWMMPQLLRIFTSEQYVKFDPVGPEDSEAAEQQTEYVHHVIHVDNNGFKLLHDWFKDALLSKVGFVSWGWEEKKCPKWEKYTGLLPDQVELVLQDDDVELTERTDYAVDQDGQSVTVSDIRIRRTEVKKRLKVWGVPPEEIIVSRSMREIEDGTFIARKWRATKSDLRELGIPEDRLDGLEEVDETDAETLARNQYADDNEGQENLHDSQRRYWVYDGYVTIDADGDGYNELRHFIYSSGKRILLNEPAEEINFADLCPVPMPHRLIGQSYADLVLDLQRTKSVLWRGASDNTYLANNPMKEIVDGQVNVGDLLTARIGGLVRVKAPNMIREMQMVPIIEPTLGMIEYADTTRENRTGLTRYNQGLDADSLNKTFGGMAQQLSQSMLRVELVARIFAETGIKRLFVGLYNSICRHQDFQRVIRIRNKWVPIDPRAWRERSDATVTVGLGTGNKAEQMQGLQMIGQAQQLMFASGLPMVTVQNLYHTATKLTELAGFKDVESFFTQPPEGWQPQQQQDPRAMAEAAKAQVQFQQKQMEMQANMQAKLADIQSRERVEGARLQQEREKLAAEMAQRQAELDQERRQFYDKLFLDARLTQEKIQVDMMGKTTDPGIEKLAASVLSEITRGG